MLKEQEWREQTDITWLKIGISDRPWWIQ